MFGFNSLILMYPHSSAHSLYKISPLLVHAHVVFPKNVYLRRYTIAKL